ncbi:MAG: hypothetical protein J6X95_03695 [Treponema sp.]|nr:hypothetical protein [Treponema sp.]
MKKTSTAITVFLICAAVFASTKQFDQTGTGCVEPHEHCLQELACDELCQDELDASGQILVVNKNPLVKWVCTTCGQRQQRAKNAGRPNPGKCPRKKNGGGHSWVRD